MTNDTRGGTRIVGRLGSADGKGAVRIEDRYDTDIDDLWSALTDSRRLARWIAEVEGDLRLGGEFHAPLHQQLGRHGTGGRVRTSAAAEQTDRQHELSQSPHDGRAARAAQRSSVFRQ